MKYILLGLIMMLNTAAFAQYNPTEDSEGTNPLEHVEGMADQLIFFDSPDAWATGESRNMAIVEEGEPRMMLGSESGSRFPRAGTWTSPEVYTDFAFTELIPSWNLDIPEETGAYFQVRSHDKATSTWSPWLYIGQWGKVVMRPNQETRFDKGRVHIDVLRLTEPADAFQLRARVMSYRFDQEENPSIRRIAVVYSGVVEDPELRASLLVPKSPETNWARNIPVPFYAQGDNPEGISGSTCSPTSLSMVTSYFGKVCPVVENAMAIYDPDYGMFGNWARATQRAAELGLDAWVTRVRTWDQLKGYVSQGQPVIASIRFREGEFPSNVIKRTNGHLIVIRGLTPEGDAIVNDPASKERGEAVIYKKDELAHAWFGHGGVAYIVKESHL